MSRSADTARLARGVLEGDVRDLARSITLVENGTEAGRDVLRAVYPRTGGCSVTGVTGFPGAGKSSLVDRLTAAFRRRDRRVGVVAVDPSSAFSGGAILGDRIRMQRHAADPAVFIRSLATRGNFGGLSKATGDAVDLLDAAGYDPVLVETVGVGQDEIEVVRAADTVLVVLVPGLGDEIQAIKAGVLEIADVFVINKADHDGTDRLERELAGMLSLGGSPAQQATPILRTVATRDQGIDELMEAIDGHQRRGAADGSARQRRRERGARRFLSLLQDRLVERALARLGDAGAFQELVTAIQERRMDPYTAVEQVLADLKLGRGAG